MTTVLGCCALLAALGVAGYLSACAGAQRWLTLGEWWGTKKERTATRNRDEARSKP